jgi:hypothetical protein
VGFRSLRESLDTTTPGSRLVLHMFGALAERERDVIRERTFAGLEAARPRPDACWSGRRGPTSAGVRDTLMPRLPTFLYFGSYDTLPGRFSIPESQNAASGKSGPRAWSGRLCA